MSTIFSRGRRRTLACVAIVAGGLLAGAHAPQRAGAMIPVDADPVIILSDGSIFDLTTVLGDPAGLSDVKHVSYRLHLPPTLSVTSVSYPDGTGPISDFQVDHNQNAGAYSADIVATTNTPGIAVTGFFGGVQLSNGHRSLGVNIAQGLAGQNLHLTMTLN
jgi:hypothetical protein